MTEAVKRKLKRRAEGSKQARARLDQAHMRRFGVIRGTSPHDATQRTWVVALDASVGQQGPRVPDHARRDHRQRLHRLVVTVALQRRRYVIQQIEGVGSNLVYARLDIDPNQQIMLQDELST